MILSASNIVDSLWAITITVRSLDTTFNDFFYNAPFFEAEVLFYHILLAQKEYFKTGEIPELCL